MKRTYFHGTSFDNLKKILREGLIPDSEKKVWVVSGRGVYLWSPDILEEEGDTEDDRNRLAKDYAYSSAQMTIGLSKSGKCVVFEIELEEEEVEDDQSCENMFGAVVCNRAISPKEIKSVWVSPDLSLLRGYFIALAMGRDLFAGKFSRLEKQIGEVFRNAEIYPEIESDYPLQPYKRNLFA